MFLDRTNVISCLVVASLQLIKILMVLFWKLLAKSHYLLLPSYCQYGICQTVCNRLEVIGSGYNSCQMFENSDQVCFLPT